MYTLRIDIGWSLSVGLLGLRRKPNDGFRRRTLSRIVDHLVGEREAMAGDSKENRKGTGMVEVEKEEQGWSEEGSPTASKSVPEEEFHDHETERIHTSYSVEADDSASFLQKLKVKLGGAELKFRRRTSKVPDSELVHSGEGQKPGVVSKIQQTAWGSKPKSDSKSHELSEEAVEVSPAPHAAGGELTKRQSSSDGERSESVFKPAVDVQDQASKDLEAASKNVNLDGNVKAPDLYHRAKEEIDALSSDMMGKLDVKHRSGDQAPVSESNQLGVMSRLAAKLRYDRSQSQ